MAVLHERLTLYRSLLSAYVSKILLIVFEEKLMLVSVVKDDTVYCVTHLIEIVYVELSYKRVIVSVLKILW